MVRVTSVEEEDRRRIGRERKALVKERALHTNRIKGLLLSAGIRGYEPSKALVDLLHGDRMYAQGLIGGGRQTVFREPEG